MDKERNMHGKIKCILYNLSDMLHSHAVIQKPILKEYKKSDFHTVSTRIYFVLFSTGI
jgi:hypothetical protein